MKKAIQYIRWSTLEQGHRDKSSEYRQDGNTRAHAEQQGWEIVERHVDNGRSAYTGANLTKGNLGKLTRRFLSGALDPSEHVIIVDTLDRLSRQSPITMLNWMTPLLAAGLNIRIANTGQNIDHRMMNADMGGFMLVMMSAFSNHSFSVNQSAKGKAAWEKKRNEAATGQRVSRHRARGWLRWDDETKGYVEIPDRVWLIREMFDLRLKGWGKLGIAKHFNELAETDERYRAFSSSVAKHPTRWTASAIARIVQDRGVLGYVQYTRAPRSADRKVPVGEPIKVYPAIIDGGTWARANDGRLSNQLRSRGRNRAVSNLIGRLARCGACGGTMQPFGSSRFRINKDGSKSQHYPFYCVIAKATKGAKCDNQRGWPYAKVEKPILDKLLTMAIDDQHFGADDATTIALEGEVITAQRRVTDAQATKKAILRRIIGDDDQEGNEVYEEADNKLKCAKVVLEKAQAALAEARGRVSPAEHIVRVAEVRERMESYDPDIRFEARSLARAAFQDLIERITFDPVKGHVTVSLVQRLGFMIIRDGKGAYLDMVKNGRDYGSGDAVEGFLRRRDGGNLTYARKAS
jgi:DNA invertase Pin-like site-specific DNA recombinase